MFCVDEVNTNEHLGAVEDDGDDEADEDEEVDDEPGYQPRSGVLTNSNQEDDVNDNLSDEGRDDDGEVGAGQVGEDQGKEVTEISADGSVGVVEADPGHGGHCHQHPQAAESLDCCFDRHEHYGGHGEYNWSVGGHKHN